MVLKKLALKIRKSDLDMQFVGNDLDYHWLSQLLGSKYGRS